LRNNGLTKSHVIAATTSKAATMNAVLTNRFGRGRAQAASLAQARFDARWTSHAPAPRQTKVVTMKMGW
jgi:hypothetical protein